MINQNSFFFLWSSPGSKHSFRPLLRSAPVSSIFFLSFVLCAALQFFQLFFGCRVVVLCAAAAAAAGDFVVNKSMEYKARQNGVNGSL
jgi:hypothetical protein